MRAKITNLLLVTVLVLPAAIFFLGDQMYTFSDETQIANFHQYFKAIDLGQFPPRWAPDMHYEYGSPFLSFNYQLPYYLGYLGHMIGLSITLIFKLLMTASFLFGAIGMFLLGRSVTSSTFFSLVSVVLYTYTPYQSIDHYVRGAIGESFALAIFPWLFLAGIELARRVSNIAIINLGMLIGLLVISHQPAALFAIPLFGLIFGLAAILSGQTYTLFAYLKSVLVGLCLSAYYWLPVILEKKYIQVGSPFNYLDHFPFIWQLIYSDWKYSGANPFSSDTLSFQIGIANLVVLVITGVAFVYSFIRKQKNNFELYFFRLLFICSLLVIGLMNIRSNFIWVAIPIFQVIQFPWRLLMFTTIFTSVLFLFLVKIISRPWDKVFAVFIFFTAFGLNISYFRPGLVVNHDDNYYLHRFLPRASLLDGESVSSEYFNHTEDYVPLPKEAIRPKSLPKTKLTLEDQKAKIDIIDSNPFSFSSKISVDYPSIATFHTFAYPGWNVTVDDILVQVKPDEVGAITFEVPSGSHTIRISYSDTLIRSFSNTISLIAVIVTVFLLTKKRQASDTSRA